MISGEVAVCAMLQYRPEASASELADAAYIAAARTALPEALDEIERLRALVPVWRPIETAPKTGGPILVFVKYSNNVTSVSESYWDYRGHWNGYRMNKPTHWMPMPAPPEEEK